MKGPNENSALRRQAADEGLAGLFTLAALLGDAMGRRLDQHGLTRARAQLIWVLHEHGAMTQRELSRALHCSPPNVTSLLDALETAGFASRQPHPTDRRATIATLTELGTRTAAQWSAEFDEFAAAVFATLDTPELTGFVNSLNRVMSELREAVAPAGAAR